MIGEQKFKAGDAARIVISDTYHACHVVEVGWWAHKSGNEFPVYKIRFDDDGAEIYCGNNSLEPRE